MGKKRSITGQAVSAAWLPVQNDDFWRRLQVFPEPITRPPTKGEYEKKALAQLEKLGRANLLYLSELAGVEFQIDTDSPQRLAQRLFDSDARKELIYLATFLRPRVTALVEFFDDNSAKLRGGAMQTDIEHLSRGVTETPKPLTKLITIFRANPASLESIHYRYAWRRLPTLFEFETSSALQPDSAKTLQTAINTLVISLNKLRREKTTSFSGVANCK